MALTPRHVSAASVRVLRDSMKAGGSSAGRRAARSERAQAAAAVDCRCPLPPPHRPLRVRTSPVSTRRPSCTPTRARSTTARSARLQRGVTASKLQRAVNCAPWSPLLGLGVHAIAGDRRVPPLPCTASCVPPLAAHSARPGTA
ncbi:hypothetical protein EON68_00355 [archaeon]|nr:MAG: hypothetical protein EON68_00355 [archaeon]